MDRNTAVTTWRDVCGSDTVMAIGIVTGRLLEEFARRIEAAERERCAGVVKARAEKVAAEAERAASNGEHDEVNALRATAWQLTVAEREILGA